MSASSIILAVLRRLGSWIVSAVIRHGFDWAAARCAMGIRRIRKKKRRIRERMRRAKSDRKLVRLAARLRFQDWRIRWRWKAIDMLISMRGDYVALYKAVKGLSFPRVADTVGRWREDEDEDEASRRSPGRNRLP